MASHVGSTPSLALSPFVECFMLTSHASRLLVCPRPQKKALRRKSSIFDGVSSKTTKQQHLELCAISPSWHFLVTNTTDPEHCLRVIEMFLDNHEDHAQLLADAVDGVGRRAIDVALPKVKEAIERRILFCGRYRVDKCATVHRSATCEVVFAEDTKAMDDGKPKRVRHDLPPTRAPLLFPSLYIFA